MLYIETIPELVALGLTILYRPKEERDEVVLVLVSRRWKALLSAHAGTTSVEETAADGGGNEGAEGAGCADGTREKGPDGGRRDSRRG